MTLLSIIILLISLFDQGIAFLKWIFDRLDVVMCLVQVGWDCWENRDSLMAFVSPK